MSLPTPAEHLPRMASDLRAHLAERGVERPRFDGLHTGRNWDAEALLTELGHQE
ncbi:bifunctional pyr operon transcriptional regulator/uracil phosphoribosyltransferase, partial [Pseudomonas aeruginosa]